MSTEVAREISRFLDRGDRGFRERIRARFRFSRGNKEKRCQETLWDRSRAEFEAVTVSTVSGKLQLRR